LRLGPYEVVSEVGRGARGAVYRARSAEGREVAVKLLPADADETARARFERERRLLGSFGIAEGFVPLLDGGESPEGPWIVMPLLGGGTLRQKLVLGPLSVERTLALGRAIAGALARAHARGVIHRDMKPENIIFDGERPLVADLGLAKHFRAAESASDTSLAITRPGTLAGTIGYMPLEQAKDAQAAGPQADVFAVGAILWECLAGKPAFSGPGIAHVLRRLEEGCEPIASVRADTSPFLAKAIDRALEKRPEDRFQDGRELEAALAVSSADEPSPIATDRRTVEHPVVSGPESAGRLLVARGRRRRRPPAGSLLVAGIVLAGSSILVGTSLALLASRLNDTAPAVEAATTEVEARLEGGLAVAIGEHARGGHESYVLAVFRPYDAFPAGRLHRPRGTARDLAGRPRGEEGALARARDRARPRAARGGRTSTPSRGGEGDARRDPARVAGGAAQGPGPSDREDGDRADRERRPSLSEAS
jgi:hypothetical protein